MCNGKLIIFSAPSGAGKTTLVKHLLVSGLNIEFSVSAASRKKRHNEIHRQDYYFISADEFRSKINNDEFLEWEEVYTDHFYGSLKSEVDRIWAKGMHVIFDVDVVGGLNIKKYYKERALAVFVMPPTPADLEKRLRGRLTESEENLQKRLNKALHELSYADKFDKILINDDLGKAKKDAIELVAGFINNDE
ncbi:MAG: guanylate kinase [Bacteroidales bacterium]|nr:guanylate kinase [Bacteroidales bacterium]